LLSRQNARTAAGSRGFEHEVESVRRRLTPAVGRQVREAERRRRKLARQLERDDRWADEASARAQLQGQRLTPSDADYDPEEPPDAESPPELLPIYFDGRAGPVALSRALGGWEARELSPEGGGRTLGVLAPPARRPSLDREAEELLEAYLRYVLDRDSFLAAVQWELFAGRRGDVLSAALEDLRTIGSVVMARAAVRSQAAGSVPTQLGRPQIEQGIRATDFDWLDRPTWGIRL